VHRLRSWLLDHVEGPDRALSAWTEGQRRQPSQTT